MGQLSVKITRQKCLETPIGIGIRKLFKEFDNKTDPLFDSYKKKVIHYYKSIQDDTLTESSLYKKLYKRFDIDNGDHSEGFFADIVDSVIMGEYKSMNLDIITETKKPNRKYIDSCVTTINKKIEEYFNKRYNNISKDDIFCSEGHLIGNIKDRFDFNTLDTINKNKLTERLESYKKDIDDIKESLYKGDKDFGLADERYLHILHKLLKNTARRNLGNIDGLLSKVPIDVALNDEKLKQKLLSMHNKIDYNQATASPIDHESPGRNRFQQMLSNYFGEMRILLGAVKRAKKNYLDFIKKHGITKFWTMNKDNGQMFESDLEDPQKFYDFFMSVKFDASMRIDMYEPPFASSHELWILGNWVHDYEHLNLEPIQDLAPSMMEILVSVEMYYENEVEFVRDIIKTTGNDILLGSLT